MNKTMHKKLSEILGRSVSDFTIVFRLHATRRLFQRSISESDVMNLLRSGMVIESYDKDKPFPSYLLNGKDHKGGPVHAVVAVDIDAHRIYIITAYRPDALKWVDDFTRRVK